MYDQVGILLLLFGMTMLNIPRGCRGRNSMVFGFTTTYAIGVYHHKSCEFEFRSGEVYSILNYLIKFVIDLR